MSHIVTIETEVRDATAIRAACDRLRLPAPVEGTHQLYSGPVQGLAVQLPDWRYPALCNLQSGRIEFDNFGGHWGDHPMQPPSKNLCKFVERPPRRPASFCDLQTFELHGIAPNGAV